MQTGIFNDQYGWYVYRYDADKFNGKYLQPDGSWESYITVDQRFKTKEDAENALQRFENRKIFWMVWREDGGSPTRRHDTKDAAITEAKRLAAKHPGVKFYTLKATGHAVNRTVEFVEY